jgi:nitrilase
LVKNSFDLSIQNLTMSTNTIIKVDAAQMSPVLYSQKGTVEKVIRKIIEPGKQAVQFATFSEIFIPYYPPFSFVQAHFPMGKEYQCLLEERDAGSIQNTQLLFDAEGTFIQRLSKINRTLRFL